VTKFSDIFNKYILSWRLPPICNKYPICNDLVSLLKMGGNAYQFVLNGLEPPVCYERRVATLLMEEFVFESVDTLPPICNEYGRGFGSTAATVLRRVDTA
jgi:hypothetical protein